MDKSFYESAFPKSFANLDKTNEIFEILMPAKMNPLIP